MKYFVSYSTGEENAPVFGNTVVDLNNEITQDLSGKTIQIGDAYSATILEIKRLPEIGNPMYSVQFVFKKDGEPGDGNGLFRVDTPIDCEDALRGVEAQIKDIEKFENICIIAIEPLPKAARP